MQKRDGKKQISVLAVEDDAFLRKAIKQELSSRNFNVVAVETAEQALEKIQLFDYDVMLLDISLPKMSGLDFIKNNKDSLFIPQTIIMTGEATFEKAVEALRLGVLDYLIKPPNFEILEARIYQAAEKNEIQKELQKLRLLVKEQNTSITPIGKSSSFQKTLTLAQMVAPTETPILLIGETGVGKDVFAHHIHNLSLRRNKPFVAINCAAIPESLMESEFFGHEAGAFTGASKRRLGYFEMAEGGTIFLDEIGEMGSNFQSKLLRAVESGTFFRVGGAKSINVDIRIISATNRDLAKEISEGRFRSDLYYRLQGFDIRIPPLRERKEDIALLTEHFLHSKRISTNHITAGALLCLEQANWRGNIRELFHVLEKALIIAQGNPIQKHHLPADIAQKYKEQSIDEEDKSIKNLEIEKFFSDPAKKNINKKNNLKNKGLQSFFESVLPTNANQENTLPSLEKFEQEYILYILKLSNGHQGNASKILDISSRTLYRKLRAYGEI